MSETTEKDGGNTRDAIAWAAKKERDDAEKNGRRGITQEKAERAFRDAIIKQERRRERR